MNYDVEGAAVGYKWFDKNGLEARCSRSVTASATRASPIQT